MNINVNNKAVYEATEKWVDKFYTIPVSIISRAMAYAPEHWEEVTELIYVCTECDTHYSESYAKELDFKCKCKGVNFNMWFSTEEPELVFNDLNQEEQNMFVRDYIQAMESDFYTTELVEREIEETTPAWPVMWAFNSEDETWAKENIGKITECGFRVLVDDVTCKMYIGLDGAGYDFYEGHWIPLYKARGLQWHLID